MVRNLIRRLSESCCKRRSDSNLHHCVRPQPAQQKQKQQSNALFKHRRRFINKTRYPAFEWESRMLQIVGRNDLLFVEDMVVLVIFVEWIESVTVFFKLETA